MSTARDLVKEILKHYIYEPNKPKFMEKGSLRHVL